MSCSIGAKLYCQYGWTMFNALSFVVYDVSVFAPSLFVLMRQVGFGNVLRS